MDPTYWFVKFVEVAAVYAHFHIFSWGINCGCFDGIGHYISDMMESAPISCGWMLIVMSIGHFGFGVVPIVALLIGLIPYYIILNWLIKIGSFLPVVK